MEKNFGLANPKFFSNGLDLDWIQSDSPHPDDPGGDREVFGSEFMKLMSRVITLPIPSIAAAMLGMGSVMTRLMSFMNSEPKTSRSPPGSSGWGESDWIQSRSSPLEKNFGLANPKFFSNGLDLDWIQSDSPHPDDPGGDREVFGSEFMKLMSRVITLPIPSIAAINGHAFGAGLMLALCHDERIMREDRGYACANEMQIGIGIPKPELALFRHKLPGHTFYETVQLARRWTGPAALDAGLVQHTASPEDLLTLARTRAEALAPLGTHRKLFKKQKESIFGENAAVNGPHGAAYMLAHNEDYSG